MYPGCNIEFFLGEEFSMCIHVKGLGNTPGNVRNFNPSESDFETFIAVLDTNLAF